MQHWSRMKFISHREHGRFLRYFSSARFRTLLMPVRSPPLPVAQTAAWVERLYTTFGLVSTFTQAGRPEAKARSMAGRMSSGRFTSSP
jgi:hypothetical protein